MSLCKYVAAAALLTLSVSANAEPVVLKVSHFTPASFTLHKDVIVPWCDTIEKESKGQLKCQIYPSLQLGGTPPQLVDQVKHGVADIVWTIPGYSAGKFPALEALELPFLVRDGATSSLAAWDFAQKYAQKELEPYKVLAVHTDAGAALHTGDKDVQTLAEFKGLRLRAASRMLSKLITSLGGAPISMPISQVTEAISKGVIDGAVASWEAVVPGKLDEVTKYHLEPAAGQPMFAAIACAMLMNKDKYNSLSPEMRALIDKHSGAGLSVAFGAAWDKTVAENRAKVVADGAKIRIINATEFAAMQKAAEPVFDEWVSEASIKGLDGKALVAAARELTARKQ